MPSRPSQPQRAGTDETSTAKKAVQPDGLFKAVSSSRVSQLIVEQIRLLLKEERLQPGDRLPSERELCVQFGVSRVTVREALRSLEASGLVEIRVGARGGAFVTAPSSQRVGEGLADLLSLSPLTATEVTEARLVFELGIVPLVVERATDEDIAGLRALCDEHAEAVKQGVYDMEMSADFHTRVAACTHNTAIEMLVQSFHGPLLMSLREAQSVEPQMGLHGSKEHRKFVDAVAARDAETASEIMRTHIRRTASRVKGGGAGK
ncbi:FadR/GntR family transcriptional regulator [Streptomyces sp. NPDC057616]|uniref:FadR/GntR family transcriptional regulator n=1 Tax=Streptomyces sp. NPDC057616 TaxID=3346183 RepID=UPI0036C1AC81